MKTSHIVIILLIAIAVAAIVTSLSDAGTYADFSMADNNPEKEYHVVGTLVKEKEQVYNPTVDPNLFTFYMKDNNGKEKKIILFKSKPQDFEKSEQIVIIGKSKGSVFEANDILMKCPSKYTEGQPHPDNAVQ